MAVKIENDDYWSINFISVIKVLRKEYKLILLVSIIFLIVGVFYALNSPKEYISTGKILPEIANKAPNDVGGIYDLLRKYNKNIDLYNTEITSPELFDEIIKTKGFCDYIFAQQVRISTNQKISFKSYFETLRKQSSHEQKKSVSRIADKLSDYNMSQDLQKRITITIAKRNDLILVAARMPDPVVAADIANFTITYLIDYITQYRTEKARKRLLFLEDMQKKSLQDSFENEAFAKEMQNSLLAATVQMKIKVQEDTPIFQILEKAQPPLVNSNPPMPLILSAFIAIGLLVGIVLAFLKNNNYRVLVASIN